jgi:hypothetical protein
MQIFVKKAEGQVVWNKQCSGVRTEADGKVAMTFQVVLLLSPRL